MTKRTARPAKADKPVAEASPLDGIGARIEAMLKEREHLTDRMNYHRSAVTDLRVQISKINRELKDAIGVEEMVSDLQTRIEPKPQAGLERAGQVFGARVGNAIYPNGIRP